MKEPSNRTIRMMAWVAGGFYLGYLLVGKVFLHHAIRGSYPYWMVVGGMVFFVGFPLKFAEDEAWPSFAVALLGLLIGICLLVGLSIGS
jgi:hypothetical protein